MFRVIVHLTQVRSGAKKRCADNVKDVCMSSATAAAACVDRGRGPSSGPIQKPLDCGSMAPSTDHFLYYFHGQGSAASLMLILVNAVLGSAIMLLACSFCKKFRTNEVNLIKNRMEVPNSELKKVTVCTDHGVQEMNGTKNGVIVTDIELNSEEKDKGNNMSSRQKNGTVHGSAKSGSDQTLQDLINRDLPPPPETVAAAPPAPDGYDPMYDSVRDLQDRLAETRQNTAPSDKKDGTSISKSNNMVAPENQDPQTLDQINPLYESADKVQDSPSIAETKQELPSHEASKDEGQKVVKEPLYAVIRKDPSVKRPPPRNPGGEKSSNQDSAVPQVVLPEKLNGDEQRVDFIESTEEKSLNSKSPDDKVFSMLNNWKKRSIKSPKPPKEETTANVTPEAPLVPDRLFEMESEVEEYKIEEDTD